MQKHLIYTSLGNGLKLVTNELLLSQKPLIEIRNQARIFDSDVTSAASAVK